MELVDFDSNKVLSQNDLHYHALQNLKNFISTNKLIQDKENCYYIYKISMGSHTQTGVMAAFSIFEYMNGNIKKHEFTRPDKEEDRTKHIDITNANTGPVFLTFKNDLN